MNSACDCPHREHCAASHKPTRQTETIITFDWVRNSPVLARKKKRSGLIACQSALHRKDRIYCPGVGVAFASGVGEAFGALRAFLRASTRVRRCVFFPGEGDAVSVAAPLAGLGDGVGSAAKTLESAIRPRTAARRIMRFIIVVSGFVSKEVLFSTEAWSAPVLFRAYRPTAACLGNRVQVSAASRQGQSGGLYSSRQPHFAKHPEKREVSKKWRAVS
jgi:hypothetical protein